jgi:glycosyltransferase involved in cell wall biosynthesis
MSNEEKGATKGLKAEHPLVTVYMPTHNRLTLLRRAVESVLAQSYQNFELIIVNDGSSDETESYLEQLAQSDSRIRCFHQSPAKGACVARNFAIQQARGVFITGLDDDDEFCADRLAILLSGYQTGYAFVCHGFYWQYGRVSRKVDACARTITLDDLLDYNYASNQVFCETEKLREIDGFDESFIACQDYDTWVRLLSKYGVAKRLAGASYIVHQEHEGPRVTAINNKVIGYQQFFDKHRLLMTLKNRKNHEFLRLVAAREKLTICAFFRQIKYGFVKRKFRYFLSSQLVLLGKVRAFLLKGSC